MTNLNLFSFYLYVVTMSLFIWDNVITPTLNTPTVITPTLNTPTIITPTLNTSIYTNYYGILKTPINYRNNLSICVSNSTSM
jgi:hypothetical protein